VPVALLRYQIDCFLSLVPLISYEWPAAKEFT